MSEDLQRLQPTYQSPDYRRRTSRDSSLAAGVSRIDGLLNDPTSSATTTTTTTSCTTASRYSRQVFGSAVVTCEGLQLGEIEYSLHECRPAFIREIEWVFPGINLDGLIAIPTMQHARHNLVKIGDDVEVEKDRLLETVRINNI